MTSLTRNPAGIAGQHYDLAIIGGGITGAGVARHAALAGLRVVLLESSDYASGTSSRSTKLIHGGLRYLAMGEVGLVRESALERKSLKAMAPHLTLPMWMVVPAKSLMEFYKLRLGISVYERLGAVSAEECHQNWHGAELEANEPLLDRNRFDRACAYREYLTDDARLVLATLRSAVARGASTCNYARVVGCTPGVDWVDVEFEDVLGGDRLRVRADVVVNAAGPWVEELMSEKPEVARLHLSKGVHIGIPRHRLPLNNIVMMTASDRRPVFAIPRGTVTYVGTTDTSAEGGPDHWPGVDLADVKYLLAPLVDHFDVRIEPEEVVSAWAGLRPLINQPGKAAKEMSRKDELWVDGRMITIAGGKLTGFRKMAEQALGAVGRVMGRDFTLADPLEPLPGGAISDIESLRDDIVSRYRVDELVGLRLARLYGSEVYDVLGVEPTPIVPSVFAEEVAWAVHTESAVSLEDLLYRRLRIPWFRPESTSEVTAVASRAMADLKGWTDEARLVQEDAVQQRLARDLAFANR